MSKSLKEFLNESKSVGNMYQTSLKIIHFIEKRIGQTYIDYDGQNFTNKDGNFFGLLFVSSTDTSAIRINWEGNVFHSINFWQDWNYNVDPTIEIQTSKIGPGDSTFSKLLPDISSIIADNNAFETDEENFDGEDEYVDEPEEELTEAAKFAYGDKIYNGKHELIIDLYNQDKDLTEIKTAVKLNPKYIKKVIANYIKSEGGSVSDVATAIGVSNLEAREMCGEPFDEEGKPVDYNPMIKVIPGAKETVTPTKAMKKSDEVLENTQYADPDLVFDELNNYTALIAKGVMPSLLVTGQNSIGKSYNIDKVLDSFGKKNDAWIKITNKITAIDLFEKLWENKDKIIVFEDCDSIFKDPDTLLLLKDILVSSDSREINWRNKDDEFINTSDLEDNKSIESRVDEYYEKDKKINNLPNHFYFEGGVIFISNLKKADLYKKDSELLSTCSNIDIVLCAQGIIKRMETILNQIKIYKSIDTKSGKDITNEDIKQEVLEFMKSDEFLKNPKVRGKEMSFRIFDSIYKLCWSGLEDWKKKACYCVD